jgi:hypothetical protein
LRSGRRLGFVSFVFVLVPCGLAASAQANLPSVPTRLIVPAESIAGVSIGESYAAASQAWGKAVGSGSECLRGSSCAYTTKHDGNIGFNCKDGRVDEVFVNVINLTTEKGNFTSPLTKLATAKGIHIGSALAAVEAAYPDGKVGGGLFSGAYFELAGSNTTMYFEFADSKRLLATSRVTGIELDNT